MRLRRVGAIAMLMPLALAASCGAPSASTTPSPSPVKTTAAGVLNASNVVLSTEKWTYAGKPGRAIHTQNYRFYVTDGDDAVINRIPLFMETVLRFYRDSFAGLPPPPGKLDTFVMATRSQWETLTRQLMGDTAETYLRIQRGGYASGGRGVYYDIGMADTLSIAGHEGWHQYTQRTFVEPLPIWLEEGIATTMEGYRWDGTAPVLLPWSNTERFDQLRAAAASDILMPLRSIFDVSPQELLAPASAAQAMQPNEPKRGPDAALTYYAQIWVLVHFLREGENGKYRASLLQLVNDAADGRVSKRLTDHIGDRAARASLMTRKGPGVAMTYFNPDLDQLAQEYAKFLAVVVRPGSRGPIVEGRSPFAAN